MFAAVFHRLILSTFWLYRSTGVSALKKHIRDLTQELETVESTLFAERLETKELSEKVQSHFIAWLSMTGARILIGLSDNVLRTNHRQQHK